MMDNIAFGSLKRITRVSETMDGDVVFHYKSKVENTAAYFTDVYVHSQFKITKTGTFCLKEFKKFCSNCLDGVDTTNISEVKAESICKFLYLNAKKSL